MPTALEYKKWFDQLFERYYVGLCNYSLAFLKEESAAEDAVQSVMTNAWEKKEVLFNEEQIDRWLIVAVKNKSIDALRKRKRLIPLKDEQLEDHAISETSAEKNISTEKLEWIKLAVSQLPEKTKQVFLLSRQQGLTYKEIADEMNISPKTVENQMSRAFRLLRAFFNDFPNPL